MGCFTKTTYNLRAGVKNEYNKNLGDPQKLTTQTYYHEYDSYHTHNVNWSYGITRYEEMKSHIESHTGYDIGCVHVNDLGATYNALNEELGFGGRALNPSQMRALYREKDATLPKSPQGKGAISQNNNQRQAWHLLNSRGVSGGRVLVNVKGLKQRAELAERNRLESIEAERLQKITDDEENRLAKQLAEKVKQDEIKRQENLRLMELEKQKSIIEIQPEIIPAVVASSLIPLAIIGFLLINSRKGKK